MTDSGLPGVTLADRDHVCLFHRGPEERDAVLAALVGARLAAGDKCLCIADSPDPETVAARLDPRRPERPEQLTVLPATAYLTDGRFVPENVYGQWHSVIGGYVDDGYRHVLGAGELSWFLRRHRAGDADAARLFEYEALCNTLVRRRPATIFCLYDLDLLDAALLPDVLRHHPAAIAQGVLFRAPWRSEAVLLAGLLLAGARTDQEITNLLDGIRRAVVDTDPEPGGERFLQALEGLAAPHRRALLLEAVPLARALLDGTPLDGAGEAQVRSLGVDLGGPLRAVVVRPPIDRTELTARGIRLAAGGPDELAFVTAGDDEPGALIGEIAGPGRVVGVGRAHPGAEGAARSYAEARRAADFAGRLDRPVVRFEDLGLFSLLAEAGDPAPMAALAAEWLGPLLDDGLKQHKLLPTLAAYLDSGAAQQATADALGIHVSTLKYRLGRIEAVTGRDLSAPDVRFQLQVALAVHRTLSVLRPPPS